VNKNELQEFLSNRVERFRADDVCHLNYLSNKALVFDVPENYKKRLQETII
jgi:hypothetical protein